MEFIDAHSHYNDEKFDSNRKEIVLNNNRDGIKRIVCAGYDILSSKKAIEISDEYEFVYATVRNISK